MSKPIVRRDGSVDLDGVTIGEVVHPRDTDGFWWATRPVAPGVGHFLGATRTEAVAALERFVRESEESS